MSDIDFKLKRLRDWLRYHSDYEVTIQVWGLYGCFVVTLSHRGNVIHTTMGETLVKRLDNVWEKVRDIK